MHLDAMLDPASHPTSSIASYSCSANIASYSCSANIASYSCSANIASYSCSANMAHIRPSGPDSGLGFQVKVLKILHGVPSSLTATDASRRPRLSPLPSEKGTNKPVKAIFWPWLEPFSVRRSCKSFKVFHPRSTPLDSRDCTPRDGRVEEAAVRQSRPCLEPFSSHFHIRQSRPCLEPFSRQTSLKPFKLFPLCSEAGRPRRRRRGGPA